VNVAHTYQDKEGVQTLAQKDVKLIHFVIIVVSTALSAASFVFSLPQETPFKPVLSATTKNPTQPTTRTTLSQYKTTAQNKAENNFQPKRKSVSKNHKRRGFRPVLVKKIKSKIVAGNSPNSVLVYNSSRSRQNGL
jgi:ABC-type microcin C transport system permease subunit YejB